MPLDISTFRNAINRLEEGLLRYQQDTGDIQIRDGLIQRFEFTYELAHKMLKRYLESASATPGEFDSADFQFLIRSANEQGLLLGDWAAWKRYREMHARTNHAYDEQVALAVVDGIPAFIAEAVFLHDSLQKRLANL